MAFWLTFTTELEYSVLSSAGNYRNSHCIASNGTRTGVTVCGFVEFQYSIHHSFS